MYIHTRINDKLELLATKGGLLRYAWVPYPHTRTEYMSSQNIADGAADLSFTTFFATEKRVSNLLSFALLTNVLLSLLGLGRADLLRARLELLRPRRRAAGVRLGGRGGGLPLLGLGG